MSNSVILEYILFDENYKLNFQSNCELLIDKVFDTPFPCETNIFSEMPVYNEFGIHIYEKDYYGKKCIHMHDQNVWIFKKSILIIETYRSYHKCIKHNIPIHILYIIKKILPHFNNTIQIIDLINTMTLYHRNIYPNSVEFETIFKTEYSNIQYIKTDLEKKQSKLNEMINYYIDMDLKFKEFEKEKQLFEENKKKLVVAKQKINEIKNNLDREKILFEKEKQEFYRTFDTIILDDFLTNNE